MSSISNNYIIDFTNNESQRAELLSKRLHESGQTYSYININKKNLKNLPEEVLNQLRKINSTSRVYFIEHGLPNQTMLGGVHYQEFAALLADNIEDKNVFKPTSQLRISLIPCYSGKGENSGLESFAGLFHRYLGQHHHVYSSVSARTKLVWTKGEKYTGNDYDYFIQGDVEGKLVHQDPGTKIYFSWDENGDQWSTDAYIHKYFSETADALKRLDAAIVASKLDPSVARKLTESKIRLVDLMVSKNNENYKCAVKVNRELKKLGSLIRDLGDSFKEISGIIEKNHVLFTDAISSHSAKPKHSSANISETPVAKEENVKTAVADMRAPIDELISQFPKSQTGENLRISAELLTAKLSDITTRKLKKEFDVNLERTISKHAEKLLEKLLDPTASKEAKAACVSEYNQLMQNAMSNAISITPEFTGALEGIRGAIKLGGWLGYLNFSKLVSIRAKEKAVQFEQLSKVISDFVISCSDYVDNLE